MTSCKYYRESEIEAYTTECQGDRNSVHESDIVGDYCPFCGGKIKFKEFAKVPKELCFND